MRSAEFGGALVAAVLLALAGIVSAHALLVLAQDELLSARAERDALLGRVARLRLWDGWIAVGAARLPADSLTIGDSVSVARLVGAPDVVADLHARRLSRDFWWIEASSRSRQIEERGARLVRQLDLQWEAGLMQTAVEVDSLLSGAGAPAISGPSAEGRPTCPDGAAPDTTLEGVGSPVSGGSDLLTPGGVPEWADRLEHITVSEVRPSPRAGVCGAGLHWGEPEGTVCRLSGVARYAGHSLRIRGGEGSAVLFVSGDLTLDGVDFRGVVVVTGALRLTGGGRLVGVARVGTGVEIVDGAVVGSLCWAIGALERSTVGDAFPLRDVGWIPLPDPE